MEFKLSEYATGKVIYKKVYPFNFDGENDIDENEIKFNAESYNIIFKEKWFDGIHISNVEIDSLALEAFIFESSYNHIGFLFCLDGSLDYNFSNKIDKQLIVSKNQQNITYGKQENTFFKTVGITKYVYIQLTTSYFTKITNLEFKDYEKVFGANKILPEISLILQSLINHNYAGRVKRLFIESKIFELIIFFIDQKKTKTVSFKEEDVNKILLAKQLVESNLQSPSSLMELSRKAGINDYKLKKGFKELTGHTVFGYLYQIRMEKAHQYLSQDKKSVNEVSFLVGYKNAQHFITAFKKKYSILPGSINK